MTTRGARESASCRDDVHDKGGGMMDQLEQQLHRTLLEYLLINGQRTLAAAALDGAVSLVYGEQGVCGVTLDLPPSGYAFVAKDQALQQAAKMALRNVANGHLRD